MIINYCEKIRTNDVGKFSWSRLAQYQNIEFTASAICKLHCLDTRYKQDARQQAEQIKHCLAQAKEYFYAATAVSLATRPVLLYYGTMSLALAEVLMKQDGNSRLQKLREQHNCHGLQLSMGQIPKVDTTFETSSRLLVAKAQTAPTGEPRGTFEVWRRSARELPVGGGQTEINQDGATTRYGTIFGAEDKAPPHLPSGGLTLSDCLVNLPYMTDVLARLNSKVQLVRGTVSQTHNVPTKIVTVETIIHPSHQDVFEKFINLIMCDAAGINHIDLKHFSNGLALTETMTVGELHPPGVRQWPLAMCYSTKEIFYSSNKLNLGEFGFTYIALHICGNFARYYPDSWLKHIESNSALAMAIDELCNQALERMPLLSLCELDRKYYVPEL